MRIAVAVEGNVVSGHFGHCEGFRIYNVVDNKVTGNEMVANPGHRPGYLPVFSKEQNADVIIAGGMGATAQELFNENGIKVVVGASGEADKIVEGYLQGMVQSTGSVCSEHAHEGHCGE